MVLSFIGPVVAAQPNSSSVTGLTTTSLSVSPGDIVVISDTVERNTDVPVLSATPNTGGAPTISSIVTGAGTANMARTVGRFVVPSGVSSYTFTGTTSATRRHHVVAFAIRGADPANIDAVNASYGMSTSGVFSAPNITPDAADALLVAIVPWVATASPFTGRTVTQTSGWTEQSDEGSDNASSNAYTQIQTKQLTGQSGISQTGPSSTESAGLANSYMATTMAFYPQSTPPTVSSTVTGGFIEDTSTPVGAGTLSYSAFSTTPAANSAIDYTSGHFAIQQSTTVPINYQYTVTDSGGGSALSSGTVPILGVGGYSRRRRRVAGAWV